MEELSTDLLSRVPQSPLILRCFRLMEAFAKSDDERDFFLDRLEGAIFYVDLERSQEDLDGLYETLRSDTERYCLIPKFTFYETKKIMEGFVNEKIYDIDTKEKLLDIIGAKGAREHFIEFLHDHHSEQEKWIQYYQERSRIRIIEWLRKHHFQFVFEEDIELDRPLLEKVKTTFFHKKISKEIESARKTLMTKAKTYYSNEALNPRPKRGRPPKQIAKQEAEPQVSADIYTTVPKPMSPFLFTPSVGQSWAATFSSKFDEESSWALAKSTPLSVSEDDELSQKLAALRQLARNSGVIVETREPAVIEEDWDMEEEDEDLDGDFSISPPPRAAQVRKAASKETQNGAVKALNGKSTAAVSKTALSDSKKSSSIKAGKTVPAASSKSGSVATTTKTAAAAGKVAKKSPEKTSSSKALPSVKTATKASSGVKERPASKTTVKASTKLASASIKTASSTAKTAAASKPVAKPAAKVSAPSKPAVKKRA